jgi:hypothetical protein
VPTGASFEYNTSINNAKMFLDVSQQFFLATQNSIMALVCKKKSLTP